MKDHAAGREGISAAAISEMTFGGLIYMAIERMTSSTTGGPVFVDVEDGKILRIMPMNLSGDDAESWEIHARGNVYKPPRKTTVTPFTAGVKSSVYSDKRILAPLKRVDFDPHGERNCEKRGESGYVPISWDEAYDIVTEEITRIKKNTAKERSFTATVRTSYGAI